MRHPSPASHATNIIKAKEKKKKKLKFALENKSCGAVIALDSDRQNGIARAHFNFTFSQRIPRASAYIY